MEKKQFNLFMFFLGLILLFNIVYGDSNGIWHYAEDVVPGTFGSDEQRGDFEFIDNVIFNELTKFNNFADFNNNVSIKGSLKINSSVGRGIKSYSSIDDGIAGITSASGKSAIYGWAKNPNAYSGYFDGGNFIISSGNVGIGTTNPSTKLDIRGNTYISGNLGVGITNPSYKLQVQGDVYANGGWLRVSGPRGIYFESYGGGWYMTDNTWIRSYGSKNIYQNAGILRTDGTFQVGSSGGTLNVVNGGNFAYRSNVLFANTAGKVGIGTSYPSQKLDVRGNTYISGSVGIGRSTSSTYKLDVLGNVRANDFFINYKKNCQRLYTDSSGKIQCGTNTGDADSDPTNELQNLYSVLSRGNSAGYYRISNLANPIYSRDAATKEYVDSKVGGGGNYVSIYRKYGLVRRIYNGFDRQWGVSCNSGDIMINCEFWLGYGSDWSNFQNSNYYDHTILSTSWINNNVCYVRAAVYDSGWNNYKVKPVALCMRII